VIPVAQDLVKAKPKASSFVASSIIEIVDWRRTEKALRLCNGDCLKIGQISVIEKNTTDH